MGMSLLFILHYFFIFVGIVLCLFSAGYFIAYLVDLKKKKGVVNTRGGLPHVRCIRPMPPCKPPKTTPDTDDAISGDALARALETLKALEEKVGEK